MKEYVAANWVVRDPAVFRSITDATDAVIGSRDALQQGDWEGMRQHSLQATALARLGLEVVGRTPPPISLEISEHVAVKLKEIEEKTGAQLGLQRKQRLAAWLKGVGASSEQHDALNALATTSTVRTSGNTHIPGYLFACYARGLLGQLHAGINLARASRGFEEIANLQRATDEGVRALYLAAVMQDDSALRKAAEALALRSEASLEWLGATIAAASQSLYNEESKADTIALRKQVLLAGSTSRKLIALAVAARRLAVADDPLGVLPSARTTPLECAVPHGKDVSISDIGEQEENAFVEIEGQVEPLTAMRSSDGKLVSKALLRNASGSANVWVVAIYTHLAHVGVQEGATLHVSGQVKHESPFATGASILIDTLPMAELSEASFLQALYQASSPWFQIHPNGLNASWTLGAGTQGAGELIFPRLRAH